VRPLVNGKGAYDKNELGEVFDHSTSSEVIRRVIIKRSCCHDAVSIIVDYYFPTGAAEEDEEDVVAADPNTRFLEETRGTLPASHLRSCYETTRWQDDHVLGHYFRTAETI
jgi:hypothetical protein